MMFLRTGRGFRPLMIACTLFFLLSVPMLWRLRTTTLISTPRGGGATRAELRWRAARVLHYLFFLLWNCCFLKRLSLSGRLHIVTVHLGLARWWLEDGRGAHPAVIIGWISMELEIFKEWLFYLNVFLLVVELQLQLLQLPKLGGKTTDFHLVEEGLHWDLQRLEWVICLD